MQNKKLSLIIIGNSDIEKCITAIYNQSYINDIEIILIYQKSKKEEILEITSKYNDIKTISYEENIFKGLKKYKKLIQGEYISILNSEDSVSIDFYRTLMTSAYKNQYDVVMSNAILEYLDGGKAYLNLSEASLQNTKKENYIQEYIKKSEVSFLWNIYGNKIIKKEIFNKALHDIHLKEEYIQNFYFFAIIFFYCEKIGIIENEVLFYKFEKNAFEGIRCFLRDNEFKNDELRTNIQLNFELFEKFLKDKRIELSINNLKDLYLNNETKQKKDLLLKSKTAWNDNLEKIKKEIINSKAEVISFDIFDTLIVRPVWSPIDLFKFMDEYFMEVTNIETGIDFSKIRIEAEKQAREEICNQDVQDITLDDIYTQIRSNINITTDQTNRLKQKEEELELNFCKERKTAKEIYELAKYLDKKIICISDMYLPIDIIKKILKQNEYYIEEIYLSSEIKLTKFKGDLYKNVLDKLKIDGERIIHIGDNYYSDYENAKKYNINSQFFPKAIDVFCNENITNALGKIFKQPISMWEDNSNALDFLGIRCMCALVANRYFDNPYRTFNNQTDFNIDPNLVGYFALGMHLYGIADWLLKDTIKERYDKIIFFARDGYWTLKTYQILKKNINNAPKAEYLYISRRALIPVSLNNRLDFYKLAELINIYNYTPKTILKYINNIIENVESLETICTENNIEFNKKFQNKSEFFKYMDLIIDNAYNKETHKKILDNSKKFFDKVFEGKTCAFDIGYSAKPELYLSKLCQKNIDTYFININNDEAMKNARVGGFKLKTYFDYKPSITGIVRESLMSISEPSCIQYDFDKKGNIKYIFDDKINTYQQRFIFDTMQCKAEEFIYDIVNTFSNYIEQLYYQKKYISLPHEMFINSANKVDEEMFYGIEFEDAVGLGEGINAINEWNDEINKKNQNRTGELFDINS